MFSVCVCCLNDNSCQCQQFASRLGSVCCECVHAISAFHKCFISALQPHRKLQIECFLCVSAALNDNNCQCGWFASRLGSVFCERVHAISASHKCFISAFQPHRKLQIECFLCVYAALNDDSCQCWWFAAHLGFVW